MRNPEGTVLAIRGEGSDRRALVAVDAAAVCPRCATGKGCGAGIFGSGGTARELEATLPPETAIEVGSRVAVDLAPSRILAAATVVYGWPLAGALLGAALAYLSAASDAFAAVCALAGLAIGAGLARRHLNKTHCLRRFTPHVVA